MSIEDEILREPEQTRQTSRAALTALFSLGIEQAMSTPIGFGTILASTIAQKKSVTWTQTRFHRCPFKVMSHSDFCASQI
jgi:hypothetical protein